ncbi:hypothetical protein V8F33_005738 [Rhypophila sp. PSN 637]
MEPVPIVDSLSAFFLHPTFDAPFDRTLSLPSTENYPSTYSSDRSIEHASESPAPDGYVFNESDSSKPGPSMTDDYGNTRPGELWCCDRWRREGSVLRHMKTKAHFPPLVCEARPECQNREAQRRDMNRHYWRVHKAWAKENNIPEQEQICHACGQTLARKDNIKRHLDKACKGSTERRRRRRNGSRSPRAKLLPKASSSSPSS